MRFLTHVLATLLCLALCMLAVSVQAAVIPSCATPTPGLFQQTYNSISTDGSVSPPSTAAMQTLVDNTAIPSLLFGQGLTSQINGTGNPFGSSEHYLNIITGYIDIPADGTYQFAVDGDDAIELRINGVVVSDFYGAHPEAGVPTNPGSIFLDAGFHEIEFRHHENTGQDSYEMFWIPLGGSTFVTVPNNVLFNCDVAAPALAPPVTASCPTPVDGFLNIETYDKTGTGHPATEAEYQTLVDNFAIPANLFGSGPITQINGSGNPFGVNQDYLSIFTGYFVADVDGLYQFGIDGDDAVELRINGNVVSDFYGGHGAAGSPQSIATVGLQAGIHELEFRHEEVSGGDNYFLYSQSPNEGALTIAPPSRFQSCVSFQPSLPTPSCAAPVSGITQTTYDSSGGSHPNGPAEYETFINTFATPANLFGSGVVTQINGSGNPFGVDSNYLTIFSGFIFAPTTGAYIFAVDGDDAVEVEVAGNTVSGFYGGHGRAGSGQNPGVVALEAGWHYIEFHHEEIVGGDNYFLFWQPPGSNGLTIVPNSNLNACPEQPFFRFTKTVSVESDPINGTVNPKAIPGAMLRYTIQAENLGIGQPDATSVNIIDELPANLSLFVNDIGTGSPIIFNNGSGSLSSGVSVNAANVSYSTDANGTLTPTFGAPASPDADGFDPDVRFIRVSTNGQMNPSDGVNHPTFSIEFRVRVE